MQRGRKFKKYENGRSVSNGETGDGTDQASLKYLSHIKRSLPRAGKSSGLTFCDVEHQCLKVEFSSTEHGRWRRIMIKSMLINEENIY